MAAFIGGFGFLLTAGSGIFMLWSLCTSVPGKICLIGGVMMLIAYIVED